MSDASPYAPFRARRSTRVALIGAVACLVGFAILAFAVTSEGEVGFNTGDRIGTLFFGVLLAAGLWRFVQLKAIPSQKGLTVINLFSRREIEWPEIAAIGFSDGAPWVTLELTDTEEISVMAIQRADGDLGVAEAGRLAALVAHHQRVDPG
ncbi:PH domain-containing protein [Ornithinimicrobium sp. Arc0846-15]|nr:PH domain-containing protein [Ornithinimicrobium laminariae]